ncbi:hypothetical protein TREES_T100005645 [Tupaia chinensis]|uniref:Uncharacterized protein n=1 Tax=Tupaia chinensis TaxID=246437 RepID=L9JAC2_TUPCH|nr:hypothetical protein TREES_T100005645 [Tupaia chinensis]
MRGAGFPPAVQHEKTAAQRGITYSASFRENSKAENPDLDLPGQCSTLAPPGPVPRYLEKHLLPEELLEESLSEAITIPKKQHDE